MVLVRKGNEKVECLGIWKDKEGAYCLWPAWNSGVGVDEEAPFIETGKPFSVSNDDDAEMYIRLSLKKGWELC